MDPNIKFGDEINHIDVALDVLGHGSVKSRDKRPEASLTAEFVQRGREFAPMPAMSSETCIAPERMAEMPDKVSGSAGPYRLQKVTDFRSKAKNEPVKRLLFASPSMNGIGLFVAVFLVSLVVLSFALGIGVELLDMFFGV